MSILNRNAILAAPDIVTETVTVPEWGGEVLVKAISAAERDEFEQAIVQMRRSGKRTEMEFNRSNFRARLAARALVDEDGDRLFSDADVELLGAKSASALDRVYEAAARLAGITKNDEEELEKNFVTTPSESSASV